VSRLLSARSLAAGILLAGIVGWAALVGSAGAQETVSLTIPPGISFVVSDVSRSTNGQPGAVRVSFSNASVDPASALRISVRADAAAFTPPSGSSIPASNVSWTTVGAGGGIGWNGVLESSTYALVFQGDPSTTPGHVDLAWTLAAPGSGIRAGIHQLTIRWKIEAVTP
jgi:hypothetical protein